MRSTVNGREMSSPETHGTRCLFSAERETTIVEFATAIATHSSLNTDVAAYYDGAWGGGVGRQSVDWDSAFMCCIGR